MAKVDWITWKTDTSEIINPEKISEKLNELCSNCENYINNIAYDEIRTEINHGGLDSDSLNIAGVSLAKEQSISIINSIDTLKSSINIFKQNVLNKALNQKEIEKQKLKQEIQDKIEEENKKLENTIILKEKISKGTGLINIFQVNNIIDNTKERINILEERLEKANEL